MKSINPILTTATLLVVLFTACRGPIREPNSSYMPDMYISRAVESYPTLNPEKFTEADSVRGTKIYYDRKPVIGSVKRGQLGTYRAVNDSFGIAQAALYINPLSDSSMTAGDKVESARLYTIYCGICHGEKLDGQGPIVASGKWAGAAANLMDLTKFGKAVYQDGRVFHSITYGKNSMGGYASALNMKQRWMVVNYIRSQQAVAEKAAVATAAKGATAGAAATKTTTSTPTTKTQP